MGRGRIPGLREGAAGTAHETGAREFESHEPFSSLLRTTRDVLFSPHRFFDRLPPDGPLKAPILYFLICSALSAVINALATLAFLATPAGIALATGSLDGGLLAGALAAFVFASLVALPVLFVVGFFLAVLAQHAFIRLVAGREQKGLAATLRVSCYSVGAPVAVTWIPLAGIPVFFYCFYLHATGLRRVHGISTGRSLWAVLILGALLLVLATALAVYDYGLIQQAIG